MFKFGQLKIIDDIRIFPPTPSLAEIKKQLDQVSCVIITNQQHYVIKSNEKELLFDHEELTLKEWLEKTKWPPSSLCTESKLAFADWRRPAIISHQDQICGVVTAEAWVEHLALENQRIMAYFHTLLETVNDAVTAVDQEGRVISWNSAAEQTYGIKRDTIIGRKIGEHFQMESIVLHRILDEGRPVRGAYHQPTPDTHVLINASPIIEGHSVIGGIATEHDITRIVKLNEELYSFLPDQLQQDKSFSSYIGVGFEIQQALKIAEMTANKDIPVLLLGEPGTGKEMLAQTIHYNSMRNDGPFLTLNCSALPSGLLEAELFGYQGGAFSREASGKAGKLEQAANGTLFIEDLDHMPMDVQIKFFQCLVEQSFYPVGSTEALPLQTRIIAAAPPSLEKQVGQGEFHHDLYYHLNMMTIEIPPLRERKEDIPELVHQFIKEFSIKYEKPQPTLPPEVMTALLNYEWPGNISQLRNVMERCILLVDSDRVTIQQLPRNIADKAPAVAPEPQEVVLKAKVSTEEEASIIEEALRKTYGNKSAAAKLLGISRGTLYNKMRDYNLS
ncbi:sigma-54-dependent Fis family transcriptional regulator [Ammoniphilus sp. YIM 78166]|uniref:sigma-54 interaction domain-containing protein n=1 Tax=Ammoniphilus sp. YIM 78166 TaxID=1644106 RepID=UPI00106F9B74|nr:sigma 54-interacting transcriptional regulator [Ammoniphilus sp. YIM 78166]